MNEELVLSLSEYLAKLLLHVNCDAPMPKKPDDVAWQTVYAFARTQSLASGIYTALEPLVKAEAPEDLCDRWDRERATDLAKHIKQTSEFKSVTAALTEAKVNFLPLKGFSFKALWKNPAYRTMSDMDIYFHPDEFDRADRVLKSLGYVQESGCDVHLDYDKKPFVKIEAHRKFKTDGPAVSFDTWESKPDNPYFHVMNHEQFLLFSIAHAKKHYVHGGCGMRVVFDHYLYLRAYAEEIDMKSLEAELAAEGLDDFFALLRRLSDYWFGDAIADEELKRAAFYIATGGTYGSHDNSVSYGIKEKGKLRYVLGRVFPPYRLMKHRYPILRKLPFLLPFLYPVRFVASIFNGRNATELRGIRNHSAKERERSDK